MLKKLLGIGKKQSQQPGSSKLAKHFSKYLTPVHANEDVLKAIVFAMRHEVYCEELAYLPTNELQQEQDDYDAYADFILLQHIRTEAYAGSIRVIKPTSAEQTLPIETDYKKVISDKQYHPDNFRNHQKCEISRLVVPKHFRRRQTDKFAGSAIGAINLNVFSDDDLRYFPFIATGLYLSAASIAMTSERHIAYALMEPSLAKSLRMLGINFQQIGEPVIHLGKRAPYVITADLLFSILNQDLSIMLNNINEALS